MGNKDASFFSSIGPGLFCLLTFSAPAGAEPSLILHHGRVLVSSASFAEALAVEDGRILLVGRNDAVLGRKGPHTRLVDLKGRTVTPGFNDAHVHFMQGALSLAQADLSRTRSVKDVQKRLAEYVKNNPSPGWVMGRNWDHTAFPGRNYPTRQDIDAVIFDRPAVLEHVDGHLCWLNTEALRRAEITRDTPDPPHGRIIRDAAGEPTGILLESAMGLIEKILPKPGREEMRAALLRALALAREQGVTSIQGPIDVSPREELELWRELYRSDQAPIRFFAWGLLEEPTTFAKLRDDFADLPKDKFKLGGLKGFVDGVISARTAALLKPYSDDPKTEGEANYTPDRLKELVQVAFEQGWQVELHAVGDRAVRMAIDACEAGGSSMEMAAQRRPMCKLEHIEVIDSAEIPRLQPLGIAASMQPSHMTYGMEEQNYNPERLGERVRFAFAWKALSQNNAILAFGTDWPVMPLDPRVALFAATTRQHFNGRPRKGWIPEEKISLAEAVMHYTVGSARAMGRYRDLGSIEPGKQADLVVFDRDLFSVSGRKLLKIGVDMTIFDGKIVYERR